jgi:tetratricopeptide (TPR) repeat protein
MKSIALILCLAPALDELKKTDVVCPIDGTRFTASEVVRTNASQGWGGVDTDFCRHAYDSLPMEHYVWTCPSCYYSGNKSHFDPKSPPSAEFKKAVRGTLKPLLPIAAGARQEQIPGWVKYDLFAQVDVLRGAPLLSVARRHLNAAWAARQSGAVRLDDYDDFVDAVRAAGLDKKPLDLAKKNRSEEDLAACRALEKEIAAGKYSGTPLQIRRYVLAVTYRRRGENMDALRWLAEADKSKGENSVIDDASKTVRESIAVERAQQKKAAELYAKAVEDGAKEPLDQATKADCLYMLGEIARRNGEKESALAWYGKALAAATEEGLKKRIEAQRALIK